MQAAVRAFQRVNDLDGDGDVGPLTMAAFEHPKKIEPMRPEGPPNRVEVSISRKLLVLYKDGAPVVVTHVSSGSEIPFCENGVCGDAVTPVGDFTAIMKIDGWEEGPLGAMFNSVYFWPAYAMHGSPSVPDVGASHGCIRIPMHIAEYFPSMITYGEPIYIMAYCELHRFALFRDVAAVDGDHRTDHEARGVAAQPDRGLRDLDGLGDATDRMQRDHLCLERGVVAHPGLDHARAGGARTNGVDADASAIRTRGRPSW